MITPQMAALENKLEKVARIMTSRVGVKVQLRGAKAYIDLANMVINLPQLTDAQATKLGGLLDGFLDLQCGHAKYRDRDVKLDGDPMLKAFAETLEDMRIAALQSELPGIADNLRKLFKQVGTKAQKTWNESQLIEKLTYAMGECWAGRKQPKDYESDPAIGALMPLMEDEVRSGRLAGSTQDALDIARKIVAKLKDIAEPPPPDDDGDGDGAAGDGGEQDESEDGSGDSGGDGSDGDDGGAPSAGSKSGKKSKSKSKPKKQPKRKPEADSDDGEDSGGDGDEGSAGDDADAPGAGKQSRDQGEAGDEADEGAGAGAPGSSDGDADDADDDADGEGDEGAGEGEAEGAGEQGVSDEARDAAKKALEGLTGGFGRSNDAGGLVNDHILGEIDRTDKFGQPNDYIVFSTEKDTDFTYDLKARERHTRKYAELKQEARVAIGQMANQLEMSLAARTQARWVGGEKTGKRFDRRQLASWMMGSDDERIFRRLEEGERIDTAISLLWDCSGSMGSSSTKNNKAALARLAAVAFHEALVRVQIPHEVLGFNTGGGRSPEISRWAAEAEARGDNLARYSRIEELNKHMVFCPFGQTDGRAICEITGGDANRDGEAVMWAAKRLAGRAETRKILIVGSDGQPAGSRYSSTEQRYLREVVKRVIAAGIEVYAIGIMDESVKHYYPTWVVLNRAEELPRAVMAQLAKSLAAQKGRSDELAPAKRSA